MQNDPDYFIGTMSGTSADGLDIAIVEISDQHNVKLVHSFYQAYPENFRSQIQFLQSKSPEELKLRYQKALVTLDSELVDFYSLNIKLSLQEAQISPDKIQAIGNHGQTIMHQPNTRDPFSLQLCNGTKLAQSCSIPVIHSFRQSDINLGGQGAPLMPAFHHAVFAKHKPCAIVNIGGISNTTLLLPDSTLGFDNGPGNTLIDNWIKEHQNQPYDINGEWGRSGKSIPELIDKLLDEPYFSNPPPKSTGQDLFNTEWLEKKIKRFKQHPPKDIQSSLYDLTAQCILNDIEIYGSGISDIYVCGGGVKNIFLMERMQSLAKECYQINPTSALGIDTDWVEAICLLYTSPSPRDS